MKKLLVVLLSLLMVVSMAACSSNEPATTEKQTVTIWHTYTKDQKTTLEEIAADFNALHEGEIEVVVQEMEYTGFSDKVYQAVLAGNGPDIIIHYASEAAKFVEDGKVADLSKYLSKDLVDSLDAGALKEATSFVDGQMHVFPVTLSGPVLFYNPDILTAAGVEVPTTWDEVYEAATKIHAYNGKYGFAVDSATDTLQSMLMQSGIGVYDGATNTALFDNAKTEDLLNWYAKGVSEGAFLANPSIDNYFSSDFNAENIAMYVGSVAGAPYLSANWEVAGMPATVGGEEWTPAWNRGVIVFSSNEAREAAAAKFAEYFASPEVNAKWCLMCNYLSPLSGTRETTTYKDMLASSDKNTAALNALTPENAGAFDAIPASSYVRTALANMMADVATGVDANTAIKNAVEYIADKLAG